MLSPKTRRVVLLPIDEKANYDFSCLSFEVSKKITEKSAELYNKEANVGSTICLLTRQQCSAILRKSIYNLHYKSRGRHGNETYGYNDFWEAVLDRKRKKL